MMQEMCYGEDPLQRVDVYRWARDECCQYMLLYLHGGLWTSGDKSEYAHLAAALLREGWAVCVANYRLSSAEGSVMAPVHTQDAKQCLSFLSALLRPRRYVLVGHSCGAHIAALLVEDRELMAAVGHPAAVVAVQGLFSVFQFARDFPEWRGELDRSQGGDERQWRDPAGGGGTEWVLVHSPQDPWVNTEQSMHWRDQLPPGTQCRLVTDIRGKHFEAVRDKDPVAQAALVREIAAVMAATEEPLEGRDERRRMQATGYRDGRERGAEEASQAAFDRGFEEGSRQARQLGAALGAMHTREQLTGREQPLKDDLIHAMGEAGDGDLSEAVAARFITPASK